MRAFTTVVAILLVGVVAFGSLQPGGGHHAPWPQLSVSFSALCVFLVGRTRNAHVSLKVLVSILACTSAAFWLGAVLG